MTEARKLLIIFFILAKAGMTLKEEERWHLVSYTLKLMGHVK